ncbi:Cyclin-A1 [Monoraphidium neglectum]|uniref:Cyclin-A1 n=1 Tax=Monoraphidium neglectum TaxID=145388 RepID=A0A0D2LED6_9CHLO|nr:Cyclin-A1 [Monoraphidium neglectum]KIZ05039.1 Cyclin-A1 [Monoraphidium neglectum]|eukprot:XP_013904058.1 Cyclin-A1 [Monoraphidium neglectum]
MRQERDAQLFPADNCSRQATAVSSAAASAQAVTPQMRCIVASWLSEVAAEFRLQQETLFLAVRLLDRFQAVSPAGVPRNVLQLVAVACMMVASKQDEVSHPSVDDFTEIAADAFQRDDLLRMERLLLDQLEWRVQLPTAYTFLHVFAQALSGRLSRRAIALSAYLSEVSLLDHLLAATPPSLVAAAALAVAAAWHGGGGGGDVVAALRAATGYSAAELAPVAARLLHLLHCAGAADAAPAHQPLVFVREKYAHESWLCISRQDAAGAAATAAALGLSLGTAVGAGLPYQPHPVAPQWHAQPAVVAA